MAFFGSDEKLDRHERALAEVRHRLAKLEEAEEGEQGP
jgi:hypothetical protein